MIKLFIVDDHAMFRSGLIRVLSDVSEISVTGEAANGDELLVLLKNDRPDLIILDISLPGKSGIALIEEIHRDYGDIPVLILSMHDEPATVRSAFKMGAQGFITKTSDFDILVEAIETCCRRQTYVAPSLAVGLALFENNNAAPSPGKSNLTKREIQILNLILKGKTLTQIGEQLGLSRKTVSAHKANIKLKLGVTSDIEFYRHASDFFHIAP